MVQHFLQIKMHYGKFSPNTPYMLQDVSEVLRFFWRIFWTILVLVLVVRHLNVLFNNLPTREYNF